MLCRNLYYGGAGEVQSEFLVDRALLCVQSLVALAVRINC
jgi:hypothetical protein